ncbi:MAG: thiamine phosphate synthase [Candidatus Margulisbacteria bacterium]|nr:thiamine phosphate synthase [Candidatus Margulisiibacteriota bacterium]MBU1616235.1 thiamine phosphate synthase [Candidatus Margulisiibacteriota bacterium]MBU1867527.1 thiamine phosphate synthase [Candidatus Margulisiibacteriota bacterium]
MGKAGQKAQAKAQAKVMRIIDANINRSMEGLRVVDEIVRFILNDRELTVRVKALRHLLQKGVKPLGDDFYLYRESAGDVGRSLYPESEGQRTDLKAVFLANIKRGEEAVRSLEEFSKLIKPAYGRTFKEARFQLYDLEKEIVPKLEKAIKLDFDLYVVTDPSLDHLRVAQKTLAAGVKMIQLRDKKISKDEYSQLAKRISPLARKHGAIFILNDYWDLVEQVGADGVHLGQEDIAKLTVGKVREKIGDDKIIGLSTHSLEQAIRGAKLGADYISCGPIFKTPSKPLGKPVGLKLLKKVLKAVQVPVVAIGGIDSSNYQDIVKTGCQRFAVIRSAILLATHLR